MYVRAGIQSNTKFYNPDLIITDFNSLRSLLVIHCVVIDSSRAVSTEIINTVCICMSIELFIIPKLRYGVLGSSNPTSIQH